MPDVGARLWMAVDREEKGEPNSGISPQLPPCIPTNAIKAGQPVAALVTSIIAILML